MDQIHYKELLHTDVSLPALTYCLLLRASSCRRARGPAVGALPLDSPVWCRECGPDCVMSVNICVCSQWDRKGVISLAWLRALRYVCVLFFFSRPDGIVLKPYALKCVPLPNASDSAAFSN